MGQHSRGFALSLCLLSVQGLFLRTEPPLQTIKDAPSPPPPTPPILSHDPLPLLMWDSYVTSRAI